MIFIKLFFKKYLNFLRYVRLVDNITNFYYKIVECCLVLKKILKKLYPFCNFQILKLVKVSDVTFPKKWVKFWEFFWKNFFEIRENFFENFTTVYKAAYNTLGD